jgi:hypothetical protein
MCENCRQDSIREDHRKTLCNNYKRIVQLVFKILQYVWEGHCRNPILKECEDDTHTPKIGTWECDFRGQNTSPWGFLYTIGKVLKRRCRKWPRMSHSDICNTSYVQKKGRESNCQFDSRPLKVGKSTRPRCVQVKCETPLESSQGELQVCFRPHPNRRSEQGVMSCQSPKSLNRDSFGTPPWESREKVSFGCRFNGVTQRILYGGRWWLPPSPGCGESCESKITCGLS